MAKPAKKKISKGQPEILIGSAMRESGANHMIEMMARKYGCIVKKPPKEDKETGKWMWTYYHG